MYYICGISGPSLLMESTDMKLAPHRAINPCQKLNFFGKIPNGPFSHSRSHISLVQAKSRSLESANDVKTGEQSFFGEIHTTHAFGTP